MKADAFPILFRSLNLSAMARECDSVITRAERSAIWARRSMR